MIMKRISSIAFAFAFLMAIVLFTGMGREIVPVSIAKYLFIIFGAIGLILNLVSFEQGKHSPIYNLVFWLSSILIFIGFVFRIQHWPYSTIILLVGITALGTTFFIPTKKNDAQQKDENLLDNF